MVERTKRDIALDSQLGFWVIETSHEASKKMYGDEVMYHILGVKEEIVPEQLYDFWFERIHPDYVSYVESATKKMGSGQKTEVEYPWNHPELGWILVRCGGNLDRESDVSIRIRGYHHIITNIAKCDVEQFHTHKVVDSYKFSRYAPYLLGAYDEIFEIDPYTYHVKTIAYKKEKYAPTKEKDFSWNTIQERVHENERDSVRELFSMESIQQLKDKKHPKSIEFRTKTIDQSFIWVKGMAFWLKFNGQNRILFVTQDIQDQKRIDLLTKDNEDIIQSLVSKKSAIIDINLITQKTRVLKWDTEKKINQISTLDALMNNLIHTYVKSDNEVALRKFLSIENLWSCVESKKEKSMDLKFKSEGFDYEWMRFLILVPPNSFDRVFLLIKNINHEQLLQYIMESFIYNSCDYVYYIDFKNDWFIRFANNKKRRNLPPEKGNGYEKTMEQFVDSFVPIEDQDMVKKQMDPDNILSQLDTTGYLSFTTGFLEEDDKKQYQYTRKRIQIQYYDKENKIILMQSMDITKSYLKQKQVKLELEKAQTKAKMDFLTGLYNRLGCEEMIQSYIEECEENKLGAFILFDLDNFKLLNDHLGHQKGDEALKAIAQILKGSCEDNSIIARLGGDEFIVFLKELYNKNDIHEFIRPLLKKLNLTYSDDKESIHLSVSVGITFFEKEKQATFSTLYEEADKAMYCAKNSGKNNYQIYL